MSAADVPGLLPAESSVEPGSPKRISSRKFLAQPTSRAEAREAIERGVISGYIYAALHAATAAIVYSVSQRMAPGMPLDQWPADIVLAGLTTAPIIALLTYWLARSRGVAIAALLALLFCTEGGILLWQNPVFVPLIIPYLFLAAGFFSAIRGALFLRRHPGEDPLPGPIEIRTSLPTPAAPISAPLPAPRGRNWFTRHWRGELSLPVSYWVFGFGLNIVLLLVATGLADSTDAWGLSMAGLGIFLLSFWGALFLILIWQSTGIWRSAGNHRRRTGRIGWAMVARAAVIVGVFQFGAQMYKLWPMVEYSWTLAWGIDDTPPYHLRLLRDGTEAELSGGLSIGAGDAVRKLLDASPRVQVVHLNSVGGFISEGSKLYRLLSERKLSTYTSSECMSACTLAFLGGAARYLAPEAKLGFHSGSFGTLDGRDLPEVNEAMAAILRERSVPEWFIDKALSTPSGTLWYPTQDELISTGIVSEIVDAHNFALSGVGIMWSDTGSVRSMVETATIATPVLAALKKSEPAAHGRIMAAMTRAVTEGRAIVDVEDDMYKEVYDQILPRYLRGGHEAELIAYYKAQVADIKHLGQTNPDACVGYLVPELRPASWDASTYFTDELRTGDANALAALFAAGVDPSVKSGGTSSRKEIAALLKRVNRNFPDASDIVQNPKKSAKKPERLCKAFAAFYEGIIQLPPKRAAAMLRYLMGSR